jgi:divalent metal cation (Fe/Co/Zn/Cd) transporter
MTKEQKTRWIWCCCHLAVAAYVQTRGHDSLSTTALSHLLLFDALGAFLCVAIDVSRNFDVWNRSSISHPFGLQRSEVLAGLATSIILLFMGLDLFSHGLTHALQNTGGHTAHMVHHDESSHHARSSVNFSALAAITSTLVSASMLGNHARIGRAIRFPLFESLPAAARNPSHLLPISLSSILLVLPLMGIHMSGRLDAILGFAYAAGMVLLGGRLCYGVGRMLLMSYSGLGVDGIAHELGADSAVAGVDEVKVWQVHYGLCMANFKLRVRGHDQVERLRERVASLVKNRLGGGYGEGSRGVKWEISTQITIER